MTRRRFGINLVNDTNPPEEPPPQQPVDTSQTAEAEEAEHFGAIFRHVHTLLSFLSTINSKRIFDHAIFRYMPESGWWFESRYDLQAVLPSLWMSAARPYQLQDNQWLPISITGDISTKWKALEVSEVEKFPPIEFHQLLAETNLLSARYVPNAVVYVLTTHSLVRWVMRRALALRMDVRAYPVELSPLLESKGEVSHGIMMRLTASREQVVRKAFVNSLCQLPDTLVGTMPAEQESGLLLDVRVRLPIPPILLRSFVADDELWVFGLEDMGRWRVRKSGAEIDGSQFVQGATVAPSQTQKVHATNLASPIPVRAVAGQLRHQSIDAVLLDNQELQWTRQLLLRRPATEGTFILPGRDYHLLVAPNHIPASIPFGIPLSHTGEGGLYLEHGYDLYPPLSMTARHEVFKLNEHSVVILTAQYHLRYQLADMVPDWKLWVGEAPNITENLSPSARTVVDELTKAINRAIKDQSSGQAKSAKAKSNVRSIPQPNHTEREELWALAQQAILRGQFLEAAQLLERGRYHAEAARYYEKAARQRMR